MRTTLILLLGCLGWVSAADKYCTKVGDVCQLADVRLIKGTDWVPTATSIKAYQELRKAMLANDKDGLVELLKSGGLLMTKSGDGVRVLDISVFNGRTEGRMTTGKYAGTKVWVTMQWVVPR